MAKVEITDVVEVPTDPDALLVRGTVEGYTVKVPAGKRGKTRDELEIFSVRVWRSHLYGDHDAVNEQRAADAKLETADSRKAAKKLRSDTARDIEIPPIEQPIRTDADRRAYLARELEAAAVASRGDDQANPAPERGLTGTVSV